MILVSAYCAVLLSFASGLLALMMNQRHTLLAGSQYCFKKFFNGDEHCRDWVNKNLDERRFPVFLRQAVFVLLGLSGIFAVIAGLSVLVSQGVTKPPISARAAMRGESRPTASPMSAAVMMGLFLL